MALEDYMESEVGIAVAATAIALSPQVRKVLRRGAVYLLAGGIRATDAVTSAAQGVANEAQHITTDGASAVQETVDEAKTTARSSRSAPKAEK